MSGAGRTELAPKFVGETALRTFDFSNELAVGETIAAQSVTAAVYSGTDANPAGVISGAASASGAVVSQAFTAGLLGVMYEATAQATTSAGRVLQKVGILAIVPKVA